jgi:hypothetical protein
MTATETEETVLPQQAPVWASGVPLRPSVPLLLLVSTSIVGLAAAHGGYFPTSWGLSATLLLWVTGLWLVVSGRTDAGKLDALYLGLLGALTAWMGLSIAWSIVPAETVLQLERNVVLLAGVTAVVVLARRDDVPRLCGVLLGAIAVVCCYSLATRLFPERLGAFDPVAGYRLSDPLGYWNTLGVFAAMGALLAMGVLAEARARWARAAAAASLVVLIVTLYYTYGRGAWIALAAGLVVLLGVSPHRLRTLLALGVGSLPVAIAVLLASRPYALTHLDAKLSDSSAAGHRLALELLLLACVAAALALALDLADRIDVPRPARRAVGAALLAVAVITAGAFVIREGGPGAITRHAWRSFSASPHDTGTNLNKRLFSLSGNRRVDLWRAAVDEYEAHRLTGGGAGTFERTWQARPDAGLKVRDAHSLYVETLAELGPLGLALLVSLLLVPVGAGLMARRQPFLPAVLAAYAAFVVHAGVDWDWEIAAATLTALLIGSVAVVAARKNESRIITERVRVPATAFVLVASLGMIFAFLGNSALARAQDAVTTQSYASAVDEANRARRLMPWSPWPLITRGDSELAVGESKAAEVSYRHAISIDSGEWRAWLGLAFATTGSERKAAFAHARRLYPRSAELDSAAVHIKVGTKG